MGALPNLSIHMDTLLYASGALLPGGSDLDYQRFFQWLWGGNGSDSALSSSRPPLHPASRPVSLPATLPVSLPPPRLVPLPAPTPVVAGSVDYAGWLSHTDLGEWMPVELRTEVGTDGSVLRSEWKVRRSSRFAVHAWTAAFDQPILTTASGGGGGWHATWTPEGVATCHSPCVDLAAVPCGPAAGAGAAAALVGTIRHRAGAAGSRAPVPVASWNFRLSPEEQPHEPHRPDVQCQRGVTWGTQGLVFDKSVDPYLLTEPLDVEISEKSLEVCFQLSDLDQLSSGVISFGFMDDPSADFDSLTYNQRRPHEWINCSAFFRRTSPVAGLAETSLELVHMAVTYSADGVVRLYRNGMPYGSAYRVEAPGQLAVPAGRGRILLGARHVWPGAGMPQGVRGTVGLADGHQLVGPFDGRITYAALYDRALTPGEVAARAATGYFKLWASAERPLASPAREDYMQELRRAFPPGERRVVNNPANRCITVACLQRVLLFTMEHCRNWTGDVYRGGRGHHEKLSLSVLNLYHVNEWLLMPSTRGSCPGSGGWDCSFVELLGKPLTKEISWFVSHWWGEPILDFIRCVQHHASLRGMSERSYYWVCAYANRQHSLGDELAVELVQTSFYKALSSAVGVLVILDELATPFRRIWCVFEECIAMKNNHLIVDIATCDDGEPKILAANETACDQKDLLVTFHKVERERSFPVRIIAASLGFDILAAEASVPSDRDNILAWMRAVEEDGVERAARRLKSHFAIAAWRQCVMQGRVETYGLPGFVQQDGDREDFVFDFSFLWNFRDEDAESLASAMKPCLRRIDLNFEWCINLSALGLGHLAARAAACTRLEVLALNLRECTRLDGASVGAFLAKLPPSVRAVDLKYHKKATRQDCAQIGEALAGLLALPLCKLHLSFRDCLELDCSALMGALGGLSSATQLAACELSFEACDIDDQFLTLLADSKLPLGAMEHLCLNLKDCKRVGLEGVLHLSQRLLGQARRLRSLQLIANVLEARSMSELSEWCAREGKRVGLAAHDL